MLRSASSVEPSASFIGARIYEQICEPVRTERECKDDAGEFRVSLFGVPGSERVFETLSEACHYAVWSDFRHDSLLTATIERRGRVMYDDLCEEVPRWLEAEHPGERASLQTPLDAAESRASSIRESVMEGAWEVDLCVRGDRRPLLASSGPFGARVAAMVKQWPRRAADAEGVFTVVFKLPFADYGYVNWNSFLVLSPTPVTCVRPDWVGRKRHLGEDAALLPSVPHVALLYGVSLSLPEGGEGHLLVTEDG